MAGLDSSVWLVGLQFSFSNPNAIPQVVKRLERKTPEERNGRKANANGIMIIKPTENCSIAEFAAELETVGYEMVDAFYKERINPKDSSGKRTYHMVRFLFCRREFVELSEEFKKVRDEMRAALSEMCRMAMWRIRVFSNPFYKNSEEIPGQRAWSINLEARKPLFQPDGKPVVMWRKDINGNRVGDAPLPLKPDFYLHARSSR